MTSDAQKVAEGLSEAQIAYLTTKAEWRKPTAWAADRWMTFPPSATHRVLEERGLVNRIGAITDLGLQVREILQQKELP